MYMRKIILNFLPSFCLCYTFKVHAHIQVYWVLILLLCMLFLRFCLEEGSTGDNYKNKVISRESWDNIMS